MLSIAAIIVYVLLLLLALTAFRMDLLLLCCTKLRYSSGDVRDKCVKKKVEFVEDEIT